MKKLISLASLFGLLACSCSQPALEPLGHVELHFDTNAPVMASLGAAEPDPPALFDRLRIELYQPGESAPCEGCSRDIELRTDVLASGASMTLRSLSASGLVRVRARMYRSDSVVDGTIPAPSSVDVIAALPEQPLEGVIHATVFLDVENTGKLTGSLDEPVPTEVGTPAPSRVGMWWGAKPVPCDEPPREGESCVPGGAFWMGNPLSSYDGILTKADQLRLVVLAPFFIGKRELTVGDWRSSGRNSSGIGHWTGKLDGTDLKDLCTYTQEANVHDAFALTCVSWDAARAYCQEQWGGDLPTEAQWEYVASGLRGQPFVWGRDAPSCGDAVYFLDAPILRAMGLLNPSDGSLCPVPQNRTPEEAAGYPFPLPTDSNEALQTRARDWIELAYGRVWDLAGNVQEWTQDYFQTQDESCWNPVRGTIWVNPVCGEPGAQGALRSIRGGLWAGSAAELRATHRMGGENQGSPGVGFRCVRSGRK